MTHLLPLHLLGRALCLLWRCTWGPKGQSPAGQLVHLSVSAVNYRDHGVHMLLPWHEAPTSGLTCPPTLVCILHNVAGSPEEMSSAQTAALALGPPQAP